MEPRCTKMLRYSSEKLRAETWLFPTSPSMFSIVGLEANPVEGQLLQQKDRERRKWKAEKEIKKTKSLYSAGNDPL